HDPRQGDRGAAQRLTTRCIHEGRRSDPRPSSCQDSEAAAARRASAWRTTWGSVDDHVGGGLVLSKPPYPAGDRLGSSYATTPLSWVVLIKRPTPWARSSAAWVAATCMKPLPPALSAAFWRADISGSSGRGKGIRSISTSWQVSP